MLDTLVLTLREMGSHWKIVPRTHAYHYYAILSDCYLNEYQIVLVDIFSLKPAGWQPDSQTQQEMVRSELTGLA